jgi:hypothetical protein
MMSKTYCSKTWPDGLIVPKRVEIVVVDGIDRGNVSWRTPHVAGNAVCQFPHTACADYIANRFCHTRETRPEAGHIDGSSIVSGPSGGIRAINLTKHTASAKQWHMVGELRRVVNAGRAGSDTPNEMPMSQNDTIPAQNTISFCDPSFIMGGDGRPADCGEALRGFAPPPPG